MKQLPESIIFFDKNIRHTSHKYYPKSEDDWKEVIENRKIIKALIGLEPVFLRQIHSNIAVYIDESTDIKDIAADGMVTKSENLALVLQTADCAPVLLYDRKNKIIGAAHAGWRGALSGVIDSVVDIMKHHGAEEIFAYIGPCIEQKNYEVGEDFYIEFPEKDFFITLENGKYLFNLKAYVQMRLLKVGVSEVNISPIDTYENHDFFSYRRFCHQDKKIAYGSNLSVISL